MKRRCFFIVYAFVCAVLFEFIGIDHALCEPPEEKRRELVQQAMRLRDSYLTVNPSTSQRTVHVVLWTPSDREPLDGYRERLSRVMIDIQEFYRSEMERLGFGPMIFSLDMESDKQVRVHLVRGKNPYSQYNVRSGGPIRRECIPVLRDAGIDADLETIVLFCNMSQWDPKGMTISQNSPYYATGGLRQGTAWQVDSALLDPERLTDTKPIVTDRQYGRISVGRYNSIFVGGVCHELGHALGLPHNRERPEVTKLFGTSLMGSGNRTYGEDRRGEGKGSRLSLADGLRLSAHPLFTRQVNGIDLQQSAKITSLKIELASDQRSFVLSGKVTAEPIAYAVIGYLDPAGGSDYDATTAVAVPNDQGEFSMLCEPVAPTESAVLRVVVCQSNGGRIQDESISIPYSVESDGKVDIELFRTKLELEQLLAAIREEDVNSAKVALQELESRYGQTEPTVPLLAVARSLFRTIEGATQRALASIESNPCWLSEAIPENAKVGWKSPMFDRVPGEDVALSIGGKLFGHGFYAHAPSVYTYKISGKWIRISGNVGLADGHDGTCVFVLRGDGKELWRSTVIHQGSLLAFDVKVQDVEVLELIVEDGGDGNGADWGLWTDVQLHR
ncbi:MAG: hypothetical protein RL240_2329 [Planctomycetota bacterium]